MKKKVTAYMESKYIALMVHYFYGKAIDKQEEAATEHLNTTKICKVGTSRKGNFFKFNKN